MGLRTLVTNSLLSLGFAMIPLHLAPRGPVELHRLDSYKAISYPDLRHAAVLKNEVFSRINVNRMEEDMRRFTNKDVYPNRHCRTERGTHFQSFLERYVVKILDDHRDELYGPNQPGFAVGFKYFDHDTPMRNIVLRILAPEPGGPYAIKPTVVVGAHMDTINVFDWDEHVKNADDMPAPGANDNASGVVVLLEALRILAPLFSKRVPTNEVQFHWYAAEEIVLHGSDAIFKTYRNQSWPIKAALNLDTVGYSGRHGAGSPKIAVQGDFVDEGLTAFVKKLIEKYPKSTAGDVRCGYACSDHASAYKYGYPAAMIGESSWINEDESVQIGYPWIHSKNDTMDHVDFEYLQDFVKVTAAFITELAYADLSMVN